ncbi:MAG: N-formylglutamate deformylase [Rhizobiales bacterium]|nr:N-formylglutamate deformylase [Hyphomicrobiales bacterium]NRB13353.1 N-formylglutamate deformylase [Hyphomicrobiales bacterium]
MQPVTVQNGQSPLILAMPHGGTYVPADIFVKLNDNGKILADTDWHIDRVYQDLAPDVTIVKASFHRYVIDANRDPKGMSLYPGQNTTNLCPLTDFDGKDIWQPNQQPTLDEINRRADKFHAPYHQALSEQIERVKAIHGYAILFDCHSIRSKIPFLFAGELPTFNIGTNDGQTCTSIIETVTVDICQAAENYTSVLNGRFKGGWTTRHYGQPDDGVHAIQMEISQAAYMQEYPEWDYLPDVATKVRPHLAKILKSLIELNLPMHSKGH